MKNDSDEYSSVSASHYRAYRPRLHSKLLEYCLGDQHFETALDVGCGVGNSSIALTEVCRRVVGYDPSEHMIQTAIRHDRVTYTSNREELTPGYDLLCFFGSLFYISQDDVASYVGMVGERGSIICCDFEILYEPVLDALDTHVERSSYDHTKNLEGYDSLGVRHIASGTPLVHFTCETRDLAHLLLTEPSIKKELLKRYSPETIYDLLLSDLKNIQSETHVTLKAKLYFSRYQTANG